MYVSVTRLRLRKQGTLFVPGRRHRLVWEHEGPDSSSVPGRRRRRLRPAVRARIDRDKALCEAHWRAIHGSVVCVAWQRTVRIVLCVN
jgi:hypothetical protein